MFNFHTNTNEENAINILKNDHNKVKELFKKFENSTRREKKEIVDDTIQELKVHASIEEEIFYPTVRGKIKRDIMNEANEEHHVAKVLIAELEQMDGTEEHFDAKYIVLCENIRHHIKEEEDLMFPLVDKINLDFEALGKKMLAKKKNLLQNGVPEFAEEKMIALIKGKGDSPAKIAESHDASRKRKNKKKAA